MQSGFAEVKFCRYFSGMDWHLFLREVSLACGDKHLILVVSEVLPMSACFSLVKSFSWVETRF